MAYAAVTGVGSYLPDDVLTNGDLEKLVDTSDEWIVTRTGIRERRIICDGETTSDLAARAGDAALNDAGLTADALDMIVVSTSSPDVVFPSTAAPTQAKLGASCVAYDVMGACTGFVYAMHSAVTAIESGRAARVLVIGADAFTRFVDFTNRDTCVLFGDGAGAVIVERSDAPGVLNMELGSDGSRADILGVSAGGASKPATHETVDEGEHFVRMEGKEVFKFAVKTVPRVIRHVVDHSGLVLNDVAWFIPHQANQRILDAIGERLGVTDGRVFSNIAKVGNTSTASIPLALDHLYTGGDLRPGDNIVLAGFGAGLTWGAVALRWTKGAP